MSGGSFDYAYQKLDDLDYFPSVLDQMAKACREYAAREPLTKYHAGQTTPATLEERATILVRALILEREATRLRAAIVGVKALATMMHDIEWVVSGDYGVDDLMKPLPVDP